MENTIWNLLGQGAPMAVGFVAIPILVHSLGSARFGILTLAWLVIGYFSIFDFGLGRAVTQAIADCIGTQRSHAIPALFWTSFVLMLAFGLAGMILGIVLSAWAVRVVFKIPPGLAGEAQRAFVLLALSLPFDISTTGLRGALEAFQRFRLSSLLRIGMGLVTFVGPLLVLPWTHRVDAVVTVLLVGRVAAWAILLLLCSQVIPGARRGIVIDPGTARSLLHVGGWITISNLLSPLMGTFDRFFVGAYVSLAAVTYYATPFEAVTKLMIIPAALAGVIFPAFAGRCRRDPVAAQHLYDRSLAFTFLSVYPLVVTLSFLAPEALSLWLGHDFARHSARVLQIVAVGVLANGVAAVPFALIQGSGRSDITAKFHLAELPIYLAAMWFGVHLFGIRGAALAWTLRVAVDLALLLLAARWLLPLAPPLPAHMRWLLAGALVSFACAFVPMPLALRCGLLLLVLLGCGIVAWRTALTWGIDVGDAGVWRLTRRYFAQWSGTR